MNLQIQRNLELFFKLIAAPVSRISESMEFSDGGVKMIVEVRSGRVWIGGVIVVEPSDSGRILVSQLKDWPIERSDGVPARVLSIADGIAVCHAMPISSDAEYWCRIYRALQLRLERFATVPSREVDDRTF